MKIANLDITVIGPVKDSQEDALEWLKSVAEDKATTKFANLPGSVVIDTDKEEQIKLEDIFAATPEGVYGKNIIMANEKFIPNVNIYDATLIVIPFTSKDDVVSGLEIIDEVESTDQEEADRLIALMAANLDEGGAAAIGELAEDESGDYVDFARKVLDAVNAAKAGTNADTKEPAE